MSRTRCLRRVLWPLWLLAWCAADDFVAQRWPEVNNTTVSSRFAAALIRQLAQSRKFVFEFTPFSGAPVRAEFAVEGLSEYLSQLEQACLRN